MLFYNNDLCIDVFDEYSMIKPENHNDLIHRDASEAHPISAITGLEDKVSTYDSHVENDSVHVTQNDKDAWNALETSKQDVIDSEHKLPASDVDGLASVATSGSYGDLIDAPTVPVVDDTMSDSSTNAIQNKVVKSYVDNLISGLGAVLTYKGTKASEAAILNIDSAKVGDFWINTADSSEWVCKQNITTATASAWEKLGFTIDLSAFVRSSELGSLAYKSSASGIFTPSGSVTINNYTPAGTIGTGSGTANYTPAGSVSTPTITVTPSTTTVNSITNVGTLPAWSMSVENETLSFSFNAGSLPTKGSDTTVATGIQSASSSQPSFSGTAVELKFTGQASAPTGSFSGNAGVVNVS